MSVWCICLQEPFGLCKAPATFQKCMMAIIYDLVEDIIEVFMDDFLVFGNAFEYCLQVLERVLARWQETNLLLNWEYVTSWCKKASILVIRVFDKGWRQTKQKYRLLKSYHRILHLELYEDSKDIQCLIGYSLRISLGQLNR